MQLTEILQSKRGRFNVCSMGYKMVWDVPDGVCICESPFDRSLRKLYSRLDDDDGIQAKSATAGTTAGGKLSFPRLSLPR